MKTNTDIHSFSFSCLSFSLKEPRFGLVNHSGVLSFFGIIDNIHTADMCPSAKGTKKLLRLFEFLAKYFVANYQYL